MGRVEGRVQARVHGTGGSQRGPLPARGRVAGVLVCVAVCVAVLVSGCAQPAPQGAGTSTTPSFTDGPDLRGPFAVPGVPDGTMWEVRYPAGRLIPQVEVANDSQEYDALWAPFGEYRATALEPGFDGSVVHLVHATKLSLRGRFAVTSVELADGGYVLHVHSTHHCGGAPQMVDPHGVVLELPAPPPGSMPRLAKTFEAAADCAGTIYEGATYRTGAFATDLAAAGVADEAVPMCVRLDEPADIDLAATFTWQAVTPLTEELQVVERGHVLAEGPSPLRVEGFHRELGVRAPGVAPVAQAVHVEVAYEYLANKDLGLQRVADCG